MSEELPPQVQSQLAQLQQLQQQAQALAAQRSQVDSTLRDTRSALEELDKLDESSVIYKSVGDIFVKSDKESLKEELSEKKETLSIRLKTLERQEDRILKRAESLRNQIQQALGAGTQVAT